MAQTTARCNLSGGVNGRGIMIVSTNVASGTVLHTASGATVAAFDETYVYLMNLTSVAKKIVVFGGGTTSGDRFRLTVPPASGGPILAIPGLRYNGSVVVRAERLK